jgi:hypothetical protein
MSSPSRQRTDDWREVALCRTADPDWFFHPDGERAAARKRRLTRARQVCVRCPVARECAAFAVASREGFGIWGGMSEDERVCIIVSSGARPRGRAIHTSRLGAGVPDPS